VLRREESYDGAKQRLGQEGGSSGRRYPFRRRYARADRVVDGELVAVGLTMVVRALAGN
jgi:hypothetical protein